MRQEESGTTRVFFFDTYALVEMIKGNPNYAKYKGARIVTTQFNLVELYYFLLRTNYSGIDDYYNSLLRFTANTTREVVKEAMTLKLKNKHRNLSYTDCTGYVVAKKYSIKFLTGDQEFENMENVEFAK